MATARDICDLALKQAGVVGLAQTAASEDTNNAFTILNQMLAQWRVKRWLVFRLVTASWAATGATSFTLGPSGTVTTDTSGATINVRPDRLEINPYIRQTNVAAPNQPDMPLTLLQSLEDYNRIRMKALTAFTQYIYYDPTLTNGTVYPWPIPNSGLYTIFISFKLPFAAFSSLDTTVNFPPEYEAAMLYQLALRLKTLYQIPVMPGDLLVGLAKDALNTLRGANTAIARLTMPRSLNSPGQYNIYSDQIN